ncbi:DUF2771 family protein [Pseudonocardia sp. GCM10023141]|uniref:DUF2771 family protein n=1 Tax=Pseudonocardia sp. GCM10023141 TaxID=3252653 RepID=UPI003613F900
MIRRALPLLAAALFVAGCSSSDTPPQVTFTAGAADAVARPTQYCDIAFKDCTNDATAPVTLAVPAGTKLQIDVPDGISSTPWHVIFGYRDATGQQVDGRSPVFAPGKQTHYELELPDPADRLLTAQVQQFGPPPQANTATGELEFPIRASWVLTAAAV